MADDKKIRHIGIDPHTRRRNKLGKRAVGCEVSDRWLEFPENSDAVPGLGDMMVVSVMTNVTEGPRKLCDLTISREDLTKALANVQTVHRK